MNDTLSEPLPTIKIVNKTVNRLAFNCGWVSDKHLFNEETIDKNQDFYEPQHIEPFDSIEFVCLKFSTICFNPYGLSKKIRPNFITTNKINASEIPASNRYFCHIDKSMWENYNHALTFIVGY